MEVTECSPQGFSRQTPSSEEGVPALPRPSQADFIALSRAGVHHHLVLVSRVHRRGGEDK